MDISIRNYRGIKEAHLKFPSSVVIAAKNGGGKSSVLEPIVAALTGQPVVRPGLRQKDAAELVHDGADTGSVTIVDEGAAGSTTMSWPNCERSTNGSFAPQASTLAGGLESLPDMTAKERAGVLVKYLSAEPTFEELKKAITEELRLSDQIASGVWARVSEKGWDEAHAISVEKGKELKGQWKESTGESYGSQKGETWTPKDWRPELAQTKDELELTNQVAYWTEQHELALKKSGSNATIRAELEKEAAMLDEYAANMNEVTGTADGIRAEIDGLLKELAELPDPKDKPIPCPHCDKPVVVTKSTGGDLLLSKPVKVFDAEEIKALRLKRAEIDTKIGNARIRLRNTDTAHEAARAGFARAEKSKKYLENAPPVGDDTAVQVNAKAKAEAIENVDMWRKWKRALMLHRQATVNAMIAKELAPEGLRKRVMAQRMSGFHTQVNAIGAAMRLPKVEIDGEMEVWVGEGESPRRYQLLCASEQMRVRVLLQLWAAKVDGSTVVVIDNVVDLDKDKFGPMLQAIAGAGCRAVMAMRRDTPEEIGWINKAPEAIRPRVYWANAGTATEIVA